MKTLRTLIIAGLVLVTGATALNAQRGMRWMNDTTRMMRQGRNMEAPAVKDTLRRGMGHGYGYGPGDAWNVPGKRGMQRMPHSGVPKGFGPGRFYCPWQAPVPGPYFYGRRGFDFPVPPAMRPGPVDRPGINRIPDLTDKQKKDIDALREKFQGEMKIFREENQKKMEEMRKSHKDKIMQLLTPDQKKWIEERNAPPAPGKNI